MTLNAVLKARQRHQTGALGVTGREGGKEQLQPGVIVIASVDYACSAYLSPVQYKMDETTSLWKRWQTLTATVLKSLLATAPAKKSVITFNGADYQIDDVGGQNSTELVWVLKAERKLPSPS